MIIYIRYLERLFLHTHNLSVIFHLRLVYTIQIFRTKIFLLVTAMPFSDYRTNTHMNMYEQDTVSLIY